VNGELHDHESLTEREWTWIAVEITIAIVVSVFVVGLLLADYVHPPQWLSGLLQFGGAMAFAVGLIWWRVGRRRG
jgi:hypothetical protein